MGHAFARALNLLHYTLWYSRTPVGVAFVSCHLSPLRYVRGVILITIREVNEARRPYTCSRPCAFEETKKTKKIRPTQNTPRNPQQPGDRDYLETARDHVPRVSPYSPASIDPGFAEIGI